MVNIINQGTLGGGFRHYQGLVPVQRGSGDTHHAAVKNFHVAVTNAVAMFRGDIITYADASHGVQGGGDQPYNIAPPPTGSSVAAGGGGTGLGNQSMTPNAARWVPADTTSVIVGCCVGFGSITLFMAKNSFQYVPASMDAWLSVDTDPDITMYSTMPLVPGTAINLQLGDGVDVKANAAFQSTRFGISGLSLDSATIAATATLPLRLLSSGNMIGNDPTAPGMVLEVTFNKTRHFKGTGAFVAD
jgi:hypothetical protein